MTPEEKEKLREFILNERLGGASNNNTTSKKNHKASEKLYDDTNEIFEANDLFGNANEVFESDYLGSENETNNQIKEENNKKSTLRDVSTAQKAYEKFFGTTSEVSLKNDKIFDPTEVSLLVSTLSSIEQNQLIDSLFNLISVSLSKEGNLNKEQIVAKIVNSLETYLQPQIDELKDIIDKITEETIKINNATALEEIKFFLEIFNQSKVKLEIIIKEKQKIVGADSKLVKKFNNFFSEKLDVENITIAKEEDTINNAENVVDKNYSKSSLEASIKTSFSQDLRLLFSGITKQYDNGSTVINFAGLPDHIDADEVVNALLDITSRKNVGLEGLLEILKASVHNPMFVQIHNAITNASEQTKRELMYKINVRRLDMYMLISTRDKYGNIRNLFKNNP